ncbi:DUF2798 domain-containing protein [Aestuariibacter sp. AA17]|uniref:DUF2798 domain-containing protein n=1 Tax=Fluctibacter corallii TaxID=2984329 RepID=A0ABT3AD68_9ALTE|nr:DUF2798 domain-containing protein [Aestuariibacter sp. AA17]MCV2886620.1 DUF2798 domain-containing protein [Aestuariibacter sp. AA17]
MIPTRYTRFVFAFVMAFIMSCLMSFCITLFNVGWINGVMVIWLKAWAFAFALAFPIVVIIAPWVHAIVNRLVKQEPALAAEAAEIKKGA